MKLNLILFVSLFLGCKAKDAEKPVFVKEIRPEEIVLKPYSNPTMILGSSFGNYFQSLYRLNDYKKMMDFTSEISIKKFGKALILRYYKEKLKMNFALGKLTAMQKIGDTTILIYSKATEFATRRKIVLNTVLENDTVKMILPYKLESFLKPLIQ
jgi:hypothetical protein